MSILPPAPQLLKNEHVWLILNKTVPADPTLGFVPYYHYRIHSPEGPDIGHLNFRVGDTPHILSVAGHIGFGIQEAFRGTARAYHACCLLAPFIRSIYPAVIITANPDNQASLRTIEKLGARFIDEVAVPQDEPAFVSGEARKRRYEWRP